MGAGGERQEGFLKEFSESSGNPVRQTECVESKPELSNYHDNHRQELRENQVKILQ